MGFLLDIESPLDSPVSKHVEIRDVGESVGISIIPDPQLEKGIPISALDVEVLAVRLIQIQVPPVGLLTREYRIQGCLTLDDAHALPRWTTHDQ